MSTEAPMTALEQQRRRLMQEREKMRARSKSKTSSETKRSISGSAILSQTTSPLIQYRDGTLSTDTDRSSHTLPTRITDERKQRNSIETISKTKNSVWNKIKSIDIKREMAENVIITIPECPTESLDPFCNEVLFDVRIQLRDTTWSIKRTIGEYKLLSPLVHTALRIELPLIETVPYPTMNILRTNFEKVLQAAAKHFEPWSLDAFVSFFDNRFGFVALMLQSKQLHEKVQCLEEAQETTKAHLKSCQETVGKQQVVINTLRNTSSQPLVEEPAPLPPLTLFEPPKQSLLAPSSVWEDTTSGIYSASRFHASQLIARCFWVPSNEQPFAADLKVNRYVTMLSPTVEAVNHRLNVFKFVSSIVKKTLSGAQVYMVCGSAAHIFLPDSSLKMGVFFTSEHPDANHWYMKVNEALCVASAQEPSHALHVQHVELVNVSIPRLHCNVGRVVVDLSANATSKVRAAYFLEAMDKLVGKDHLFKRSLLLVHGWLVYENGAADDKYGEIISMYGVAIMVLHVFNLYHESLFQPLQVATRFFGIFAAFPWDGFCVSIEGPRDMHCLTKEPTPLTSPLLIPPEVVEAHRTRRFEERDFNSQPQPTTPQDDMLQFKIKYINIMNPIDPTMNLGEFVTAKQAASFRQILDQGATKLHAVMMALKKETTSSISTSLGSSSSVSLLDTAFRGITHRFQCGWRPDNANFDQPECTIADDLMQSLDLTSLKQEQSKSIDALTICSESLRDDLMVCDCLLHARVTSPALCSLTSEILADKGPLPIGEIGKCLQDITSNSSLSAILKEQFGGLKKFLEQFPSIFLISTDHPFNPKVYLHRMLSESGAAQVLDGSIDVLKKKKTKPTRRKKAVDIEQRSLSLMAISSQDGKKGVCVPPPGFGFPSSQQRSLSLESSLKLSATSFIPAGQRKSVGFP